MMFRIKVRSFYIKKNIKHDKKANISKILGTKEQAKLYKSKRGAEQALNFYTSMFPEYSESFKIISK